MEEKIEASRQYLLSRADRLFKLYIITAAILGTLPVILTFINLVFPVFRSFSRLVSITVTPAMCLLAFGVWQKAWLKQIVEKGKVVRGKKFGLTEAQVYSKYRRIIPDEIAGRYIPTRSIYYEFEVDGKTHQNTQMIFSDEKPVTDEEENIIVFVLHNRSLNMQYAALNSMEDIGKDLPVELIMGNG